VPLLFVSPDAEQDLEKLVDTNKTVAYRITVLLEALQHDPDLLDRLSQHNYGQYGLTEFDVSKWLSQWNQNNNLWRLKIKDLEQLGRDYRYRIIYAFLPRKQHYHVLAVVHRDTFNYETDPKHPITQRVLKAYASLRDL
jgi:hypothetical protein